MATTKKITELTAANAVSNADLLYLVQNVSSVPTSKKITVGNLLNYVNSTAIDTKTTAAYTNAVAKLGNFTFNNNVITTTNSTVNVSIRSSNVDLNMISNTIVQIHYNSNSSVASDYSNSSSWAYVSSGGFFAEILDATGSVVSTIAVESTGVSLTSNSFTWDFSSNGMIDRSNTSSMSYSANSSNWANPAPTTIEDAINRLAVLVKSLNSGTGA
jgi:hypothetical protein